MTHLIDRGKYRSRRREEAVASSRLVTSAATLLNHRTVVAFAALVT